MKKYKNILFDLDNTLVDDYENRKYAISQILQYLELDATDEYVNSFIKFDNEYWTKRAKGLVPDPVVFSSKELQTTWVRAHRFEVFFDISFEEAIFVNNMYCDALKQWIVPIDGAKELLTYLNSKGYNIYIATNGVKIAVYDKLSKIGVFEFVSDTFAAEEIGFMKPKREFFEGMFKKIGDDDRSKVLLVGDEIDKDVLGAYNNGIDSCWLNRFDQENITNVRPTYEVRKLLQIKDIL